MLQIQAKIFIIRAPWIFPAIFKLVRPMLDKGVAAKIEVHGDSSYLAALTQTIPIESLPQFLGGECSCPDADRECCSSIGRGGMVPKDAMEQIMKR